MFNVLSGDHDYGDEVGHAHADGGRFEVTTTPQSVMGTGGLRTHDFVLDFKEKIQTSFSFIEATPFESLKTTVYC